MSRTLFLTSFLIFICLSVPPMILGQDKDMKPAYAGAPSGWTSFARGDKATLFL